MSKMNEIKERMAKLELNEVQGSKHLEGVHSRLNQIEAELHKGKNELSETVRKEVNEAVSWEMEGVKREISVLFKSRLSKLEQHLEDTIITLVGKFQRRTNHPQVQSIIRQYLPDRDNFRGEI